MIKHIIFDLDGTLLYTLDDLKDSVNYALREYGYKERTLDEVRAFVGNGVKLLVKRALPADTDEETFDKVFSLFKSHYEVHSLDTTRPFDGIILLLEELKKRGITASIVSNKFDSAVKALKDHFFKGLIASAYGESEILKKKPEPDTVFAVMRELGAKSFECLYVGDSDVDILTAKNTGIPCVSVLWGFRDKEFLEKHGASVFIEKPSDLLNLL